MYQVELFSPLVSSTHLEEIDFGTELDFFGFVAWGTSSSDNL